MVKEIVKANSLPIEVDGNTGLIVEEKMSTSEIVEKVKAYIDSKEKHVLFNGKRYPEIDDWEFIGTFYGLKLKTFDPTFIEIDGKKGFKARAALYDENQNEVGRAESLCMNDEPMWARKPLFQLASMAQTRAGAKAYSNIFRPIAKMCSMETTPAEEMGDVEAIPSKPRQTQESIEALGRRITGPSAQEIDSAEEVMTDEVAGREVPTELASMSDEEKGEAAVAFSDPPPQMARKRISEKQGKLLFAKRKQANVPDKVWKAFLKDNYGITDDRDIEWPEMTNVLTWIDRYGKLA